MELESSCPNVWTQISTQSGCERRIWLPRTALILNSGYKIDKKFKCKDTWPLSSQNFKLGFKRWVCLLSSVAIKAKQTLTSCDCPSTGLDLDIEGQGCDPLSHVITNQSGFQKSAQGFKGKRSWFLTAFRKSSWNIQLSGLKTLDLKAVMDSKEALASTHSPDFRQWFWNAVKNSNLNMWPWV